MLLFLQAAFIISGLLSVVVNWLLKIDEDPHFRFLRNVQFLSDMIVQFPDLLLCERDGNIRMPAQENGRAEGGKRP